MKLTLDDFEAMQFDCTALLTDYCRVGSTETKPLLGDKNMYVLYNYELAAKRPSVKGADFDAVWAIQFACAAFCHQYGLSAATCIELTDALTSAVGKGQYGSLIFKTRSEHKKVWKRWVRPEAGEDDAVALKVDAWPPLDAGVKADADWLDDALWEPSSKLLDAYRSLQAAKNLPRR